MTTSVPSLSAATLGRIFFQRVKQLGDRTFVKLQRGCRFEEISWRDFGAIVQKVLLALYALGPAQGETMAIIGENCLPWLCADLATLAGGFPNVVAAPALSDRLLLKILAHSGCCLAFVQNEAGAGRLLNLKGQLPGLSHIVLMEGSGADLPHTISFDRLVELGSRVEEQRLYQILESVHGRDLATIMYTSGSTGEPKGVMRTQNNLLSNITNGADLVLSKPEDLTVMVLSLNHLFGRFGFLKSAVTGRTTALIEATELGVDSKILEVLRPTALTVVPRVMERIWTSLTDAAPNRELWLELERLDWQTRDGRIADGERQRFEVLRARLSGSARQALGGRIKYVSYGGAAMPPRIMRFFELIGIPLIGSYGSTECGGVTLCGIGENRPGNLGKPFANVEIRIADDNEIFVRGPTVSPGYFKDPAATREAFDPDGWYHTGDLGALDQDGSLRMVGRKKDIFNCSDGSNMYPGFIELRLENERFIRQAILLGDRRPFVAALVVPNRETIAESLGRDRSSLSDDEVENALWTQIERVNAGLEHYERVHQIVVMETDFSPEVRALNAFHKVKVDRKAVAERFGAEIERIYSNTEGVKQ